MMPIFDQNILDINTMANVKKMMLLSFFAVFDWG